MNGCGGQEGEEGVGLGLILLMAYAEAVSEVANQASQRPFLVDVGWRRFVRYFWLGDSRVVYDSVSPEKPSSALHSAAAWESVRDRHRQAGGDLDRLPADSGEAHGLKPDGHSD